VHFGEKENIKLSFKFLSPSQNVCAGCCLGKVLKAATFTLREG